MLTTREELLDYMIARSFATKTAILLFGAFLILVGTELRVNNPLYGYPIITIGLLTDWAIVYLVYVEITRMRDDIEQSEKEIRRIQQEVGDVQSEITETQRNINRMHDEIFDTAGTAPGPPTTTENLEKRISKLSSDIPDISGLERRVSELERQVGDSRRRF